MVWESTFFPESEPGSSTTESTLSDEDEEWHHDYHEYHEHLLATERASGLTRNAFFDLLRAFAPPVLAYSAEPDAWFPRPPSHPPSSSGWEAPMPTPNLSPERLQPSASTPMRYIVHPSFASAMESSYSMANASSVRGEAFQEYREPIPQEDVDSDAGDENEEDEEESTFGRIILTIVDAPPREPEVVHRPKYISPFQYTDSEGDDNSSDSDF